MSPRQEEPLRERFMMQKKNTDRAISEGNGSLIIKASPYVVTDFLIYAYRDKKRQVSTIKGYKFMISNTLQFSSKSNIKWTLWILLELINSFLMQSLMSIDRLHRIEIFSIFSNIYAKNRLNL